MRLTRVGPVGPLDLSRPASQPPLPGMMAVAGPSISSHNFGAVAANPSYMGHQRQQRQQHYGDAYLGDTTGFSSEVSGGCSSLLPRPLSQLLLLSRAEEPPLLSAKCLSTSFPLVFQRCPSQIYELISVLQMTFWLLGPLPSPDQPPSQYRRFQNCTVQRSPLLSFRPPVLGQLVTQPVVIVGFSTLPLRKALTGIGATQTATETRILRYG